MDKIHRKAKFFVQEANKLADCMEKREKQKNKKCTQCTGRFFCWTDDGKLIKEIRAIDELYKSFGLLGFDKEKLDRLIDDNFDKEK